MNKELIFEILCDYFGLDWKDGTYYYLLTRVKESRYVGTMTIDDFVELDEEEVYHITDYLVEKYDESNESQ